MSTSVKVIADKHETLNMVRNPLSELSCTQLKILITALCRNWVCESIEPHLTHVTNPDKEHIGL